MVDMLALGGLYSDLEESFQKKLDVLTTQMASLENMMLRRFFKLCLLWLAAFSC